MNKLKILNINNGETVTRKFIESTIYNNLVILDMKCIAEYIADTLIQQKQSYGWDEIEYGDYTSIFDDIIYDTQINIYEKVHEILKEKNIEHQYL